MNIIDVISVCRKWMVCVGKMKLHWFCKMTRRMLKIWNPSRSGFRNNLQKKTYVFSAVWRDHSQHLLCISILLSSSFSSSSSTSPISYSLPMLSPAQSEVTSPSLHSSPFSTWEKFCPLLLLLLVLFMLKVCICYIITIIILVIISSVFSTAAPFPTLEKFLPSSSNAAHQIVLLSWTFSSSSSATH